MNGLAQTPNVGTAHVLPLRLVFGVQMLRQAKKSYLLPMLSQD